MSITSEINRLQTAKAGLKTAIENKGVTVSSSTKLDGYANLVDSIVTAPYIVNPLNGSDLGNNRSSGIITHQYQVSGASIVSGSLSYTPYSERDNYSGLHNSDSQTNPNLTVLYGMGVDVSITNQGLISYNYDRSQSDVNEYEWLNRNIINVTLILDNGCALTDYFRGWAYYSCFIKDTNIILADKTNKKVQDITYDDELLVWNFDEGKYDSAKPLWIKKTETTTWYYKLKFSNGLELNVTGTYPEAHSLFSVEDGKFIHANRLVGKKVYTLDGIATLESCEEVHENVEFYNIITNYHMNLFANNVLTSTSLNNLYPINDMKFVKTQRQPVFDYTKFSEDWIVGVRLKEQPTDVTEYCLDIIKLKAMI